MKSEAHSPNPHFRNLRYQTFLSSNRGAKPPNPLSFCWKLSGTIHTFVLIGGKAPEPPFFDPHSPVLHLTLQLGQTSLVTQILNGIKSVNTIWMGLNRKGGPCTKIGISRACDVRSAPNLQKAHLHILTDVHSNFGVNRMNSVRDMLVTRISFCRVWGLRFRSPN